MEGRVDVKRFLPRSTRRRWRTGRINGTSNEVNLVRGCEENFQWLLEVYRFTFPVNRN